MVMGQATGTAAAIAVKQGLQPRQVDVGNLRPLLAEQGVDIDCVDDTRRKPLDVPVPRRINH